MKISSASKKVLCSALSAAMVVAFAPTVAMGATSQESGEEAVAGPDYYTVATVTYQDAAKAADGSYKKYTETFKSNMAETDDEALKQAIEFAEVKDDDSSYKDITITMAKDVASDADLEIDGDITLDLGGYTLSNVKGAGETLTVAAGTPTSSVVTEKSAVIYLETADVSGKSADEILSMLEEQAEGYVPDQASKESYEFQGFFTKAGADYAPSTEPIEYTGSLTFSYTNTKTETTPGTPETVVTYYQPVSLNDGYDSSEMYTWDERQGKYVPCNLVDGYKQHYIKVEQKVGGSEGSTGSSTETSEATVDFDLASSAGKYVGYKLTWTDTVVTEHATDGTTVIENGTITSVDGDEALYVESGAKDVVLGKGAVVRTANAMIAVAGEQGTEITLQEGATVSATRKADSVIAIASAGTVTTALTDAQKAAKADIYETIAANVSAELTDGDGDLAVAIAAASVQADATANVSAAAAKAADTAEKIVEVGDIVMSDALGGLGLANADQVLTETAVAAPVVSAAVASLDANLKYGNYTADYAAVGMGNINYGHYAGKIYGIEDARAQLAGITVNGGAFSLDPAKELTEEWADGDRSYTYTVHNPKIAREGLKVTDDGSWYYVYRNGEDKGVTDNTQPGMLKIEGWDKVQKDFLDGKTEAIVKGQADKVAVALTDGNRSEVLELKATANYLNPYSDKNRADNAELFEAIDAQAAENIQHVQGIYTIDAALYFGQERGEDGALTDNAAVYEQLADLGSVQLKYAFGPVDVDSAVKVYSIGSGATAELESTTDAAIAASAKGNVHVATNKVGAFGITYSTVEDVKAQIEAEQAKKEAEEAAKKAEEEAKAAEEQAKKDADAAALAAVKSKSITITLSKAGKKAGKTLKTKTYKIANAGGVTFKKIGKTHPKVTVSKSGVVTVKKGATITKGASKTIRVLVTASNGAQKEISVIVRIK